MAYDLRPPTTKSIAMGQDIVKPTRQALITALTEALDAWERWHAQHLRSDPHWSGADFAKQRIRSLRALTQPCRHERVEIIDARRDTHHCLDCGETIKTGPAAKDERTCRTCGRPAWMHGTRHDTCVDFLPPKPAATPDVQEPTPPRHFEEELQVYINIGNLQEPAFCQLLDDIVKLRPGGRDQLQYNVLNKPLGPMVIPDNRVFPDEVLVKAKNVGKITHISLVDASQAPPGCELVITDGLIGHGQKPLYTVSRMSIPAPTSNDGEDPCGDDK